MRATNAQPSTPQPLEIELFDQWGPTDQVEVVASRFSWRAEAAESRFSWRAEAVQPRFSWRAEAA